MYIELSTLFWGIIGIIGAVALVYLIILLRNISKLVSNLNEVVIENKKSINTLCNDLPKISEKCTSICDNINDISEVVTETTADVIVAKENITNNIETIKDILNIIVSTFFRK